MLLRYIINLVLILFFVPSLVFGQILIVPPFPGGIAVVNTSNQATSITHIFSDAESSQDLNPGEKVSFHTWDFDHPLLAIFSPSEDVVGTFIY